MAPLIAFRALPTLMIDASQGEGHGFFAVNQREFVVFLYFHRKTKRPLKLRVFRICQCYHLQNDVVPQRKGVRVVYGCSLENCRSRKVTVGSNPTPSAEKHARFELRMTRSDVSFLPWKPYVAGCADLVSPIPFC